MKVGQRIKKLRKLKGGLTQAQLAGKIPMDQSQYSRIEKDKTDPTLTTLFKVAQALDRELVDFFEPTKPSNLKIENRRDIEKLEMLQKLEENDKFMVFQIIDRLYSREKMKESLAKLLDE